MRGVVASIIPFVPAATKAAEPDPIYAAIERHKAANAEYSRACSISCNMLSNAPGYEEADAATGRASEAETEAAIDLTDITPTTRSGLVALLQYVLETKREYPAHYDWPVELSSPDVTGFNGKPVIAPFHFWLLRNVLAALDPERGSAAA